MIVWLETKMFTLLAACVYTWTAAASLFASSDVGSFLPSFFHLLNPYPSVSFLNLPMVS